MAGILSHFLKYLMPRAGMTAVMLSLMLTLPTYADEPEEKEINITATPIELNEDDPQQKYVGKLRYIEGVNITSSSPSFGGISGLPVSLPGIDNRSIPFITDNGYIGTLMLNNHFPRANLYSDTHFFKIPNLPSNMSEKITGDAEAVAKITINSKTNLLISFEQMHRIVAYDFENDPIPLPLPAEINQLQNNGGLETMEALSDGRLLLMAEHPTLKTRQHFGWIGTAPKDDPLNFSYITRLIAPPEGYSPTDATELPNGDVLVLLRRFTPADGVSAKFWRISKAMLDESGPIKGEVIATLKPPLSVDNMEGIALIDVSKDGNPIIAVISDDNFNPLQRTLLMIFEVMKQ